MAAVGFALAVLGLVPASAIGAPDVLPDRPVIVVPPGGLRPGAVLVARYDGQVNAPGEPFAIRGTWLRCAPTLPSTVTPSCSTAHQYSPEIGDYPAVDDDMTHPYVSTYEVRSEDIGAAFVYELQPHRDDVTISRAVRSQAVTFDNLAPWYSIGNWRANGTRDGAIVGSSGISTVWGSPPFTERYAVERCDALGLNCVEVGAADRAWVAGPDDVGHTIRYTATVSNPFGSVSAATIPSRVIEPIPTANTIEPAITGATREGATLTADVGRWAGTIPVALRPSWERCDQTGAACEPLEADSESLPLTAADAGGTIRLTVTASGRGGTVLRRTAPTAIVEGRPVATMAPAISGATLLDGELTATSSSWRWASSGPTLSWERCDDAGASCSPIAGATAERYRPTVRDIGARLRVVATARNSAGDETASRSSATVAITAATPAIVGVAREGELLTGHFNPPSGSPQQPIVATVSWERCHAALSTCEPIVDANGSRTLRLRANEIGRRVRHVVTLSQDGAQATLVSAQSAWVVSGRPTATMVPEITGIARDGETLVASPGEWTGTQPLAHSWQWLACDVSGAACEPVEAGVTEQLRVTPDLVGATLRVRVTTTGPVGFASETSAATSAVAGRPPVLVEQPRVTPPTQAVVQPPPGSSLTAAVRVGGTLDVGGDAWDGTHALRVDVQWEQCSSAGESCRAIPNATARSYTPTAVDVDRAVRAAISATNVAGTAHAVTDPVLILAAERAEEQPALTPADQPAPPPPAADVPRRAARLSISRPATRCVPQLRARLLAADGPLSIRGELPAPATVLAGGRPLLLLESGTDGLAIRTAEGRLLGVAPHAAGTRWHRRTSTRVSARAPHGQLLIAVGRHRGRARGAVVIKGRTCTMTAQRGGRIATRADRQTRTTIYVTSDTGAPIANAAIDIADGQAHTTVRSDAHGRARLPLAAGPSRNVTVTFGGDQHHQPVTLPVTVDTRGVSTLRGEIRGASVELRGRVHGSPATRLLVEYLDQHRRWRRLGTARSDTSGRWALSAELPALHAGSTQLVVRAVLPARAEFRGRVGSAVRVDLDLDLERRQ